MFCFYLRVLLFAAATGICWSYSYTDVDNLYNNLTSGYNKQIRPHIDQFTITRVTASFNLISLQEIDEVEGSMKLSGFFVLSWKDDNLRWNPNVYNGIEDIELPHDIIWKPPIANGNTMKQIKIITVDHVQVNVRYSGRVEYYPGDSFVFTCDIDSSNFPFDTQKCSMEILSWGYSNNSLVFKAGLVNTELFVSNSEWELTGTTITTNVFSSLNIPGFVVEFRLKRRSYFFIMNLLLPVNLLGLLNVFVFILPQESGERVGFSITALLSVVVFITIAQGILPATAMPKLAALYEILIQDMAVSGSIVVSVIIGSWMYHRKESKRVPTWIKKCILLCTFRHCCKGKTNDETTCFGDSNTVHAFEPTEKKHTDDTSTTSDITWPDVSQFWDKISFWFYLILFIEGNIKFLIDTL